MARTARGEKTEESLAMTEIGRTETGRAVPAARWRAKREGIDLSLVKGSGPGGVVLVKDLEGFKVTRSIQEETLKEQRVRASTLARKLAEREGVALESVEGSGTRGRVMMADVERAAQSSGLEGATEGKEGSLFGKAIPMTKMRKVIAKRMAQSAFSAPHIYFFTDVEMDRLNQLREEIVGEFEKRYKVRISVNDFLIKAVALTLTDYPMLNAMVRGEEIYVHPEINVGLAVAMEEGLIVPAITRADRAGLGKIAQMRADLVERARTGKLKMEEIERGTFTISSLAQFEITFFTAILNPPQSGILSVGKTVDQLALKDGQVTSKKVARLGLSVDHRIIDGAVAAGFLQSLKKRLEAPSLTFMNL
jgi:pyruvate dehydrogenase E2 component (dihydrolipoamide acetyltransferase)